MNDNFNRAPGAGRIRSPPADPGFVGTAGDPNTSTTFYNQTVSPLRQPRTSPSFTESPHNDTAGEDLKRQSIPQQSAHANNTSSPDRFTQEAPAVNSSTLSASAPEFVPAGMMCENNNLYFDGEHFYGEPCLADMVTDFLGHLSTSPGSFESDIGYISDTINSWVNTEETLNELVDLIFTQSTTIPNFSYTGARLCNYLSHHLAISPPSGNFRQLLLKRCQVEYQQRDAAARGDAEAQKKLHSFVLFLGELYLNLEVKSAKGSPDRAHVLLSALNDLMNTLFSHPVDTNLICAVKLLKLTGSVLEDEWKESGKAHMDELIQRIETILLDATCSRDVRQMLLKLVELRSSDWGRVRDAVPASNATPDNDPNYFMNEPTFYTEDGIAFTAADPEFAEKYQEMLARQDYFHDTFGENGNEAYDDSDDELEPEMAEAFESFYLETEMKKQQRQQPPNH
ncbi:polyadenylate-binding protein-interacting protein 1 [Takifugu flavidus]|uniref:Polyadenylate-binding protein-interacting protein 1 n=2 Tax=Takifugu TaxID=31032 RepID=A0A5C6MZ91_9TELE|nr:polyadenylate-binding protein-interacting protein 1 [Takifugu flavidus]TWW60336.1 Polyadenylate-binding protein-interacting protein 1 [Takifugu flavidus]